jgi:hypothetical protein
VPVDDLARAVRDGAMPAAKAADVGFRLKLVAST